MDWQKLVTDAVFLGMNGTLVWHFMREIKCLHDRDNVHDRIVSRLIDHEFDSHAIARGAAYPKIKKTKEV